MPRSCNKPVGRGTVSHLCTVLVEDHQSVHLGPCSTPDQPVSVRERQRWLAGEEARRVQGEFQGEPQTTAQSKTENPTPVPQSKYGPVEGPKFPTTIETRPGAVPESVFPAAGTQVPRSMPPVASEGEHPAAVAENGPCEPCVNGRCDWCHALARNDTAESQQPRLQCWCYDQNAGGHEAGTAGVPTTGQEMGFEPPPGFVPERAPGRREGDQRLPTANHRPIAHDLVKADLDARLQVGIRRYGQGLQAMNGRNMVQDAYEEMLDASVYLKSLLGERTEFAERVDALLAFTENPGPDIMGWVTDTTALLRDLKGWLTA